MQRNHSELWERTGFEFVQNGYEFISLLAETVRWIQKRPEKEVVHSIDWHISSWNSSSSLITASKNVKIHLSMKISATGLGYKSYNQQKAICRLPVSYRIVCIPWRYDKLFQRRNHLHRMGEKFIHKALLKKHENNAEN